MNIKKTTLHVMLSAPFAFSTSQALAEYIDLPEGSVSSMLQSASDEEMNLEMSEAENQFERPKLGRGYNIPEMMPGGAMPMADGRMPHRYRPDMGMSPGQGHRYMGQGDRRYMNDFEPAPPRGMGYRSPRHMGRWGSRDRRSHMHDQGMPMMGMMHGKREHMQAHMARVEKKLTNIEYLLGQLVELHRK